MREVSCLVFLMALMMLPDVVVGTLAYTFRRVFTATRPSATELPSASIVVGPLGQLSRSLRRCALTVGRVSLAATAAALALLVALSVFAGIAVLSLP